MTKALTAERRRVARLAALAEMDSLGLKSKPAPVIASPRWWTCGQSPCPLLGRHQWSMNPQKALIDHDHNIHSTGVFS